MCGRARIIIADDEELICTMLTRIIDFDGLGLELIGTALDGESLLAMIQSERPDIVITDISMPKADGLEIIARTQQLGISCKFIIISGYRQFEYAYNALKYDVREYLLKPIDQQALNMALAKIVNDLRAFEQQDNQAELLRSYFVNNVIVQPQALTHTLEKLNSTYSLKLREGLIMVLILKLDYQEQYERLEEDTSYVTKKLADVFTGAMATVCYDVVCSEKHDGLTMLINFAPELKQSVYDKINQLYIEEKKLIDMFSGMNLTFCVGDAVRGVNLAELSHQHARQAMWMRMVYGVGRVIFYENDFSSAPASLEKRLDDLKQIYTQVLETLDPTGLPAFLDEVFSLPETLLCREPVRLFVRYYLEAVHATIQDLMKDLSDYEGILECYSSLRRELQLCTSFKSMHSIITGKSRDILQRLNKDIKNKPFKTIRLACNYIEENYGRPISLNDIADVVNLSPVYFSSLFKKETGQNLTDYIVDVRLKKAKELLRNTTMNVNEIAAALSFSDARYFSKLFKRKVGIKPSEYRKIYG